MLRQNDLKYIIHFFIHNPIEKEKGRTFYGYFPIGKAKDALTYVRNEHKLQFNVPDTQWVLFDGKSKKQIDGYTRKVFNYINNKDGTIRWIYPEKLKKPLFLNFYAKTNLRSRIIAFYYILMFLLRLKSLARSGSFTIYRQISNSNIKHYLMDNNNLSIFTGTIGPNRKALMIAKHSHCSDLFYVKIPLTERAYNNIKHESRFLNKYNHNSKVHVPVVKYWNDPPYLFISNVKPNRATQSMKLNKAHVNFIIQHARAGTSVAIKHSKELKEAYRLFLTTDFSKIPDSQNLHDKIKQVFNNTLIMQKKIIITLAHGDFTPWNCYTKKDEIFLFDWEMAKTSAPVLFDLFHFIVQKGIMVERKSFKQIKKDIMESFDIPAISWFINNKKLNPIEYFKYYLLINASYYLNLYSIQKTHHEQVRWQIDFWNEAFTYFVEMESPETYKGVFIRKLGDFLQNKEYALIKRVVNPLDLFKTNNDLDLLVTKKTSKQIYRFCKAEPGITFIRKIRRSYMQTLEIHFDDLSYIRIDMLHDIRRKNITFVNIKKALQSSTMHENGWKYIDQTYEIEYIKGFYWLNKNEIPERYVNYYHLSSEDISDKQRKNFIKKTYNNPQNNYVNRTLKNLLYLTDVLLELLFAKGVIITYSGVDGAGKTTVLNQMAAILKEKYRKEVVVLKHRPSILPIISALFYGREKAEAIAAQSPPHSGNNNNKLLSYLRFIYYLFDYIFGQFVIYFKYIARGYVVIYDRFYFDFISDAKRSNIVVDKKVVRFFYRFILKPDYNFFLYAEPDIILSRKKELTREEIVELTKDYHKLFSQFGNKYKNSRYVVLKNTDITKTIKSVEYEFVCHLN